MKGLVGLAVLAVIALSVPPGTVSLASLLTAPFFAAMP
jgi:hypothetical protein